MAIVVTIALRRTRVRPSSRRRGLKSFSVFPDLSTVAATVPGFEYGSATGFFAAAHTPVGVVQRLNREAVRHLARPEMRAKSLNIGLEAACSTPGELAALIRTDISRLARIVRGAGVRVDWP